MVYGLWACILNNKTLRNFYIMTHIYHNIGSVSLHVSWTYLQNCTVWKVVNDTLKKLTANLTTQLYSKFQSNLRKDLTLQNGFIGPLDYKFMYLVHATPPYNCDLELGQNHYIKWHFCSFQINFLLCLVYKLVKKTSDWWHTDHNKSPQKGIGKKYEIELLCRDAT